MGFGGVGGGDRSKRGDMGIVWSTSSITTESSSGGGGGSGSFSMPSDVFEDLDE